MYNHTNNGHANLSAPITESTTTFLLSGAYDTLPTSNFIAKLSKFTAGVLSGRENVFIATRTGSTCTGIVRAFESVPLSDTTNAQVQQALPFSAGDIIEVVISSEFIRKNLRSHTENGIYVSKDSAESVLQGVNGQVVGYDASNKPTTFFPTVSIVSLPEITTIADSDNFIVYDGTGNKKITKENLDKQITNAYCSGNSVSQSTPGAYGWTSSVVAVPNGGLAEGGIWGIYNSGSAHPTPFIQWSANGTTGWTNIMILEPGTQANVGGTCFIKPGYTRYTSGHNGYTCGHFFTVQTF